ncbi:hypothetical protein [Undibacterium flavidum]|uniref:MSHA biogenesis protein MshJ n=1 Tax=Undibacterium flavidum TaxID=2762297 RepID=A0ABR6YFB3_9BURK|nr:hypothetical protein [Undibacterium flavidum]MBC3875271.1 hypothetical protein [Undibacterium flavidum]
MNKQLQNLMLKIDALSVRERGILFALCTVGVLLLGFILFIEPQIKLQQIVKKQHESNLAQVSLLQTEIDQLSKALKIDPDIELKLKINEAKVRLVLMDKDLLSLKKNLVQPEKMDGLLQELLKRNRRLQLTSMKSLPVVNLLEMSNKGAVDLASVVAAMVTNPTANPAANPGVNQTTPKDSAANNSLNQDERSIYKHEVELELEGNYLDMLEYIKALEAMPERVYWSRSTLKVLEYPKSSMTLRLFTLSLEKKWLNL